MQIDNVPGLTIHQHEGKLAGAFDLPPASLANLLYDGRVMLVIVADVGSPFNVTTAKDGTHTAHWTFKAADAAIVTTDGMRELLTETYSLEGADAITPPSLFDEDDEALEDFTAALVDLERVRLAEDDMQEFGESKVGQPADDLEEITATTTLYDLGPIMERLEGAREAPKVWADNSQLAHEDPPDEVFEVAPRGKRDKTLEQFLNE